MRLYQFFLFSVLFSFSSKGFSQNQADIVFYEVRSYQLAYTSDTLDCTTYSKLLDKASRFNQKQIQRAKALADSMSRIDAPCYKYSFNLPKGQRLQSLIIPPSDCPQKEIPPHLNSINTTIQVLRIRQPSTQEWGETVYCR